jgi:TusA-related sulfurtransferase
MKDLVFVCAHPDIPYFHWQTKVYTHNFIEKGIKPENIHVLFVMVNGSTEPTEESLKLKDLGINVHHYLDDRKNKRYIPSLRPLALSRWLKEYPQFGKCYFYHDGDIIFRELPDFDKLLQDDIVYLSDTLGYINYDYILSCSRRYEKQYPQLPKDELLKIMTDTIGVTIDDIKKINSNSGGAQYLIKNTDYKFWEKVYEDCGTLYEKIFNFDRKHPIPHGGLQIWTSDMWSVLWNLILTNHDVKVTDDLDFSWATDTIEMYEKKPILHMAGVTDDLKSTKFYKGEYINVDPIEKLKENKNHFDYIEKNSSTLKYIEVMKSYIEKTKN